MAVPPRVVRWVDDNYKRPRVDPEWLNDCYAWLTTEEGHNPDTDFQGLVDAVTHQILESNFSDSMLPGTGLPTHIAVPTTSMTLKGVQVLVEVASITEIANSAFNLDQTRQAREERLRDGNVEDEDGEGDIDIAGEGPVPKYPRGMLKLLLTDGTTTLPAIEYRPLPELSLENTPLGFKMLLKDVRINRGIAFLAPKCVVMMGHKTDERDENRPADFAKGLRVRMGLPEPPPAAEDRVAPPPAARNPLPQAPPPPPAALVRSPLREISPPPSPPAMYHGNDDEDLETRRRRIPNRNPAPEPPAFTVRSLPSSSKISTTSVYFANSAASSSRSQTAVGSAPPRTTPFLSVSPTLQQTTRPLRIASPPPSPGPDDEHFWSDDEMETQMPPPQQQPSQPQRASLSSEQRFISDFGLSAVKFLDGLAARKGTRNTAQTRAAPETSNSNTTTNVNANAETSSAGARDVGFSSDEFDDDISFDSEVLAGLDAIEALNTTTRSTAAAAAAEFQPPSAVGSGSRSGSSTIGARSQSSALDVITIDDDSDEDDKENLPVPTRHVRRRFDGGGMSQGTANQRARDPGRPIVLARSASDVIDVSDSD
ncbi:hypothetical protein D9615_004446 [Tricholomella constricta]|uniref:RecQ-mediated genome instability protein 1 n=1 Tax=Tricholomella constricta TaxID=117010 RepID=A0A8H5HEX5_9AGAR|nr:hypothetical protein D9615_004446 [Tricholomella constricta]